MLPLQLLCYLKASKNYVVLEKKGLLQLFLWLYIENSHYVAFCDIKKMHLNSFPVETLKLKGSVRWGLTGAFNALTVSCWKQLWAMKRSQGPCVNNHWTCNTKGYHHPRWSHTDVGFAPCQSYTDVKVSSTRFRHKTCVIGSGKPRWRSVLNRLWTPVSFMKVACDPLLKPPPLLTFQVCLSIICSSCLKLATRRYISGTVSPVHILFFCTVRSVTSPVQVIQSSCWQLYDAGSFRVQFPLMPKGEPCASGWDARGLE